MSGTRHRAGRSGCSMRLFMYRPRLGVDEQEGRGSLRRLGRITAAHTGLCWRTSSCHPTGVPIPGASRQSSSRTMLPLTQPARSATG